MLLRCALLLAAVCPAMPATAHAQTQLRWKLAAGESLAVAMQQQTVAKVSFSGKSATTKIEMDVALLWKVVAADETAITIKQTAQRVQLTIVSESEGTIKYDSAAKSRSSGQVREVEDAVKPIIGAEIEVKMTARGEVTAVKPTNDAAQELFAAADKPGEAGVFSPASIQKLLRQPLVVLPDQPVAEGDTWTTSNELAAPAGPLKQTTTYKLAAAVDRAGQRLQQIDFTARFEPATPDSKVADADRKLAVKTHQQSGMILFSADSGRLVEASQDQTLITERPYRETTIVVSLTSKQTTTVKPVP
jgi:hypothetical protein